MSDLLSIGRSGVLAYQGALAAIGENVTNADTDGFARRSVTLTEQTAVSGAYSLNRTSSAFGGVKASAVTRVWDQYKAANAWSANSDASRSSTRSQYLSTVESMLDDSDTGIGTRLTAVFTAGSRLAADPTDSTLRQTMIAAVGDAATALGTTGANLAKVANTIRTQATTLVDQSNDQLAALGKLNVALHSLPPGTSARAQVEDQRDQLLGSLSGNIAVDVTFDSYGAVSLKLNDYGGATVLAANDAAPGFLTLQTASDGRLAMSMTRGGATAASNPTGGVLSGLIDASAMVAGRRSQLDGLANGFVVSLNGWQAGGLNTAGTAGAPLLAGNSAATIALATTDPNAIAAATSAGSNANLLVLSTLRGANGIEAGWSGMVTDQALLVSSAKTEATASTTRKDAAFSALDETSGIDLDAEAAELLRFQQAYSASAKIIQTARQTFQSVLDLF